MAQNHRRSTTDLVLVRSDSGDGGWSLHPAGSTDDQIASGDAPYLASGPARWDDDEGDWDRPNASDYAAAHEDHRHPTNRVDIIGSHYHDLAEDSDWTGWWPVVDPDDLTVTEISEGDDDDLVLADIVDGHIVVRSGASDVLIARPAVREQD